MLCELLNHRQAVGAGRLSCKIITTLNQVEKTRYFAGDCTRVMFGRNWAFPEDGCFASVVTPKLHAVPVKFLT
jgi:hypothetical protein